MYIILELRKYRKPLCTTRETRNEIYKMSEMPHNSVCGLCLSRNRSLSTIGSYYTVYKLIGGRRQNTLLACWECISNLKRIHLFQTQVVKAENILESADYVQSLSQLSSCIKKYYDGDYKYVGSKDNKAESDCEIFPDFGGQMMSANVLEPKIELEEVCETWVDNGCFFYEVPLKQLRKESNKSKLPRRKKITIVKTNARKKEDLGTDTHHTEVVESRAEWIKRISKILRHEKFSKRQHACLKCGMSFHTNKGLDNHLEQLHTKSPSGLPCVSCDCVASTSAALSAHASQHMRLQCSVCNFTTRRQETISRHADTHSEQRVISCEMCGKQFRNRQHFLLHRTTHTSNQRYECDDCGRVYTTRHQIFRHLRQHKKTFLCHVCGKTFSTSTYLACHSLAHEGESGRRFECGICQRRYVNKFKLEVHERFHTGEKPYECTVCSKKFRERAQLRAHCRKLHPENAEPIRRRTFERTKSAFVNERFSELKAISEPADYNKGNNSERVHADNQRESEEYICSFCGKKFNDRWRLKFHLAVHSDDRPFKCTECDLTFKYQSGLWTHKFVHRGEKPHQCTICGSQFTQKGNLTAHLKIHTDEKPFECTICGNKFRMKRTLKNHLKVHTGIEKGPLGIKLNSQTSHGQG